MGSNNHLIQFITHDTFLAGMMIFCFLYFFQREASMFLGLLGGILNFSENIH